MSIHTLILAALMVFPGLTPQEEEHQRVANHHVDTSQLRQHLVKELQSANAIVTVYDYFDFSIVGQKVIFRGFTIRPQNKQLAERIAKRQEWVRDVQNDIAVLPLAAGDRDIRKRTYSLLLKAVPRAFPTGYAYIRIGVDHGHVTLVGVVDHIDRTFLEAAAVRIKQLPLVKEVTNDILVRPKN